MLFLNKSNNRIKIECSCGMYSLAFRDRDIQINRSIRCLSCGSTSDFATLLQRLEFDEKPAALTSAPAF